MDSISPQVFLTEISVVGLSRLPSKEQTPVRIWYLGQLLTNEDNIMSQLNITTEELEKVLKGTNISKEEFLTRLSHVKAIEHNKKG